MKQQILEKKLEDGIKLLRNILLIRNRRTGENKRNLSSLINNNLENNIHYEDNSRSEMIVKEWI